MSLASLQLQKAYEGIPQGKVLDVSKLELTDRGIKGIRTINQPKIGGRSKKMMVDNLPIVSNNADTYSLAMELLGGEFGQFAGQFGAGGLVGTTAATPGRRGRTPLGASGRFINHYNRVIEKGKVLDVSNLQPTGLGAKSIPMPQITQQGTFRGAKRFVGEFPGIVSNNAQKYRLAME